MQRHLCRHCNGVAALVVMTSLLSPMRMRLAIVGNDGTGATGDSINDNCNSATIVNNDDNSATDDKIDDSDCDGQGHRRQ